MKQAVFSNDTSEEPRKRLGHRKRLKSERPAINNGDSMNDYTRGVFEALSWVEKLVEDLKEKPEGWKVLAKELHDASLDIKRGVAVDFRHRLRATS